VTELYLQDGNGVNKAHLYVDNNGMPKLDLLDAAGTIRICTALAADGTPSIDLRADNGRPVLTLAVGPGPRGAAAPSVIVTTPTSKFDLLSRLDDVVHHCRM